MAATMLDQARAALRERFGTAIGTEAAAIGTSHLPKRSEEIQPISTSCEVPEAIGTIGAIGTGKPGTEPIVPPESMDALDSFEWAPDPSRPVAQEMVTAEVAETSGTRRKARTDDGPHDPCPKCSGLNFWRPSMTKEAWRCQRCIPPHPNVWTDGVFLPAPARKAR